MAPTDSSNASNPSNPSATWDQVGGWMQNLGALGLRMLDRQMQVWSAVSNDLRDDKYDADDMARDFAKVMTASIKGVDDAWRYATQPPLKEQTARTVPTAFLLFRELDDVPGHSLASPVYIDIPFELARGKAPEDVKIELSGTAKQGTETTNTDAKETEATDAKGVDALMARIMVKKVVNADQYVLLAVNDQQALAGGGTAGKVDKEVGEFKPLIAGVYQGLVYLENPPVALASLRVVVTGPVSLSPGKSVGTKSVQPGGTVSGPK